MNVLIQISILIISVYGLVLIHFYFDAIKYVNRLRKQGIQIKIIKSRWWICEYKFRAICNSN